MHDVSSYPLPRDIGYRRYSYVASPELQPVREQVQNFESDGIKIFGATTVVSDSQSPWDVRLCKVTKPAL